MGAIDKHARTGRTTRLLQEARRLSDEGRAVYVIVSSDELVKSFQTEEFRRRGIKVETMASVGNLELETMRLRYAHPNCAVLVDHYVIERRFRPMLEMLHRFDLPALGVERVANTDATVHRILKGGGDLSDCVSALAAEKESLVRRITELESIAPKRIRLAAGGVATWHCPDDLIPIQEASR